MEPGDAFTWSKWLADLLGPGGFVASIVAGGEGWFIYKLMLWHHAERKETLQECQIERKEWTTVLATQRKNTQEAYNMVRENTKALAGVEAAIKRIAGFAIRKKPR